MSSSQCFWLSTSCLVNIWVRAILRSVIVVVMLCQESPIETWLSQKSRSFLWVLYVSTYKKALMGLVISYVIIFKAWNIVQGRTLGTYLAIKSKWLRIKDQGELRGMFSIVKFLLNFIKHFIPQRNKFTTERCVWWLINVTGLTIIVKCKWGLFNIYNLFLLPTTDS